MVEIKESKEETSDFMFSSDSERSGKPNILKESSNESSVSASEESRSSFDPKIYLRMQTKLTTQRRPTESFTEAPSEQKSSGKIEGHKSTLAYSLANALRKKMGLVARLPMP